MIDYEACVFETVKLLTRIADALDRAYPKPIDRSKIEPAGPERLLRTDFATLAQWERDDADARARGDSTTSQRR